MSAASPSSPKSHKTTAWFAALVILGAAICVALLVPAVRWVIVHRIFGLTYVHRFRLTVEVEADGQIRSGSTVIEVRTSIGPDVLRPMNSLGEAPKARGEALFIDLGPHGPLVMTLHPTATVAVAGMALDAFTGYPQAIPDRIKALETLEHLRARAEIPASKLCRMVTFDDILKPATIREVNPSNLEQTFGPNVRFKSATIEMTDAPVTVGIGQHLPWLKGMSPSAHIDPKQDVQIPPLPESIGKTPFEVEDFG
jgi:hypothetical protein